MDDLIVMADSLVFVDAIEAKPGNAMRVQIFLDSRQRPKLLI